MITEQMAPPAAIPIDVISDVICPWCFVGKRRLEKAVAAMAATPLSVRWRPYQLDPAIPPGGMPREDYLKRKFSAGQISTMHQSLIAAGAIEGIDFRFDRIKRSPNTIEAHRLIRWAFRQGREGSMVERLFHLYFLEGKDIGDRLTLSQAASDVGLDAIAAAEFLSGDDARDEVVDEIEAASRIGVTGGPTFIIAGRYAVIGAQDARYIAGAIAKARADAVEHPGA
jgi:predicted DsbA family dithiol-disulfide isomerase